MADLYSLLGDGTQIKLPHPCQVRLHTMYFRTRLEAYLDIIHGSKIFTVDPQFFA